LSELVILVFFTDAALVVIKLFTFVVHAILNQTNDWIVKPKTCGQIFLTQLSRDLHHVSDFNVHNEKFLYDFYLFVDDHDVKQFVKCSYSYEHIEGIEISNTRFFLKLILDKRLFIIRLQNLLLWVNPHVFK